MEIASQIITTTETSYTHDQYTSRGVSPLFELVAQGNLRKLQSTLTPQSFNIRDSQGMTLIHTAVQHKQLKILSWLLATGLLADSCDIKGATALHLAVQLNNLQAVELLLNYQAPHKIQNDAGITPLQLAQINKFDEIVAYLLASEDETYHANCLSLLKIIIPQRREQTKTQHYPGLGQKTGCADSRNHFGRQQQNHNIP